MVLLKEVVLKHLLNYSYFPYTSHTHMHAHTRIELQEAGADGSESRRERHAVYIGHICFHLHHAKTGSQSGKDIGGGGLKAYIRRQVNRHENEEVLADRGVSFFERLSRLRMKLTVTRYN